jgi:uncharacterized membrane protein YadS
MVFPKTIQRGLYFINKQEGTIGPSFVFFFLIVVMLMSMALLMTIPETLKKSITGLATMNPHVIRVNN